MLSESPINLYLNLMKSCLLNSIYRNDNYDEHRREYGRDLPVVAHTMIGKKRLDNIQYCVEKVISDNVPGDLIETGVWRGGATIFMRSILKVYGIKDRIVWVADSFQGLPAPNLQKYPLDQESNLHLNPQLAISLEEVTDNFKRYDLLDSNVKFLKGWFKDTLPTAPITRLSLLRLDGDLYESTMDALVNLYPKLSVGGFVIIDDYGCYNMCRQAISDYRQQHNITDELISIDGWGYYWRKSKL